MGPFTGGSGPSVPCATAFRSRSTCRNTVLSRRTELETARANSPATAPASKTPGVVEKPPRARDAAAVSARRPHQASANRTRHPERPAKIPPPLSPPSGMRGNYHDFRSPETEDCGGSEHRSDGEVPLRRRFPRATIEFPAVVDADGTDGRQVAKTQAGGFAEIEAVHRIVCEPDAPRVDEHRPDQSGTERNAQFGVQVHHHVAAGGRSVHPLWTQRFLLEAANGAPPPEKEPFLDRNFLRAPVGAGHAGPAGENDRVAPEQGKVEAGLAGKFVVIHLGAERQRRQLRRPRKEGPLPRVERVIAEIEDREPADRSDGGVSPVFGGEDRAGRDVRHLVPRQFVLQRHGRSFEKFPGDARHDARLPEVEADAFGILVQSREPALPLPPVAEDPRLPQIADQFLLLLAHDRLPGDAPAETIQVPLLRPEEAAETGVGPPPSAELHLEEKGLFDLEHQVQDPILRTLDALDPDALVEPRAVDRLLEPEKLLLADRPPGRDRVLAQDRRGLREERTPDHDVPEAIAGSLDDREAQRGSGVVVEDHLRVDASIQVAGVAVELGYRILVCLGPDVVEVRAFLVSHDRQEFGPEKVVVPREDDFPDPVSRSLLDTDRLHDPATVVPGVVDPQDLHPGVPGLLVQPDDRVQVVVPILVAEFPGLRDPMEGSAGFRRHLPAENLPAQPMVPGESDILDVALFPFRDQHGERSPARGRLLDGDGDVDLQVIPPPIKRDQPLPKIAHQGALGDLLFSPEPGGPREAVRRERGGALPTHVVLRPLLDLDDRAQKIGCRLASRDGLAHVHGEEPRPLVLAPHAGESPLPAAEVVRLSRFRTEKPGHLFG